MEMAVFEHQITQLFESSKSISVFIDETSAQSPSIVQALVRTSSGPVLGSTQQAAPIPLHVCCSRKTHA